MYLHTTMQVHIGAGLASKVLVVGTYIHGRPITTSAYMNITNELAVF